jgi:hypothetical protein
MVITGIVKLRREFSGQAYQKTSIHNSLDHSVQDFEEETFLLIVQFLFTLLRDLFVHFLLPAKELDHTDDIHDLADDLHTRISHLHFFVLDGLQLRSKVSRDGEKSDHGHHSHNSTAE